MDQQHKHDACSTCCSVDRAASVCQTLPEMEFERGIWYAAQDNDIDRVECFLRKGISPDVEDSAGYTALHYAARNGHCKLCEILLRSGANVDARTRSAQATALQRAATQGHVDVVALLLKSGANVNLKDTDGYTALHRAVLAGSESVCKLLTPHTDLTSIDKNGHTVSDLAEQSQNNILQEIIAAGEKINCD